MSDIKRATGNRHHMMMVPGSRDIAHGFLLPALIGMAVLEISNDQIYCRKTSICGKTMVLFGTSAHDCKVL